MKIMISGHRIEKLINYDHEWIKTAIYCCISVNKYGSIGYSGMASGVDLWFCECCQSLSIPYIACIPFIEQSTKMSKKDSERRQQLIDKAKGLLYIRNSEMIERTDRAIIVWDGNKGGTHNCFQQLVEKKRNFYWINPVKQTVVEC
jgi:uncharacterized phage-like protein YoqJ